MLNKKMIISLCLSLFIVVLAGCDSVSVETGVGVRISSFNQCVEEGGDLGESDPRHCSIEGETFVEDDDNK